MSEVKYSKEHEWIKLDGDVQPLGLLNMQQKC